MKTSLSCCILALLAQFIHAIRAQLPLRKTVRAEDFDGREGSIYARMMANSLTAPQFLNDIFSPDYIPNPPPGINQIKHRSRPALKLHYEWPTEMPLLSSNLRIAYQPQQRKYSSPIAASPAFLHKNTRKTQRINHLADENDGRVDVKGKKEQSNPRHVELDYDSLKDLKIREDPPLWQYFWKRKQQQQDKFGATGILSASGKMEHLRRVQQYREPKQVHRIATRSTEDFQEGSTWLWHPTATSIKAAAVQSENEISYSVKPKVYNDGTFMFSTMFKKLLKPETCQQSKHQPICNIGNNPLTTSESSFQRRDSHDAGNSAKLLDRKLHKKTILAR